MESSSSLGHCSTVQTKWADKYNHMIRDAWHTHTSLPRAEAKRRYIATLIATMHQYATTTPEARELVAELEFVWDQIKDNSPTATGSSGSSGAGGAGLLPLQGQARGESRRRRRVDSFEEGEDGGTGMASKLKISGGNAATDSQKPTEGGTRISNVRDVLRRLRPMSEGDEEEEAAADTEEDSGNDDDDVEYDQAVQRKPAKNSSDAAAAAEPLNFPADPTSQRSIRPIRDLDVRNRKWRKRMEQALVKLSLEVAALREQIEARRRWGGGGGGGGGGSSTFGLFRVGTGRGGLAGWFKFLSWMVTTCIRHVVIDAVVMAILLSWSKRRGNRKLQRGLLEVRDWMWEVVRRWRVVVSVREGLERLSFLRNI